MMPAVAPQSARRAVVDWPVRHRAWLQHLDRVAVSGPQFERAGVPRLRPFPDWARPSAAPPRGTAAK